MTFCDTFAGKVGEMETLPGLILATSRSDRGL